MKNILFALAFLSFILAISCQSEKAKATHYHDFIVLTINKVFDAVTHTEKVFEQTDTLLVEKQLINLEFSLNKALTDLNKTPAYQNDTTLKAAAEELIFYYQHTVMQHYQNALTRMKETQSTSKKDMILGLSIFSTYNKEDSLSAVFEKKTYPLQKKIHERKKVI